MTAVAAPTHAIVLARETIAHHSKSFALASKLLPAGCRDEAAVIYAWCRRADDAIDLVPAADQPAALARLERELDAIARGDDLADPILAATRDVVQARAIPVDYLRELLAGMAMDVDDARYPTLDALLVYCFRVAGTVGLMMCHVMGVRDRAALRHAVHLGIAMQLTNVCRDVAEDWTRNRLYLPADLLSEAGAASLDARRDGAIGDGERRAVAQVVERLLAEADRYYASGDRGLPALSWRCALAVRTARLVYSSIGARLARRRHDALAGRVVVSTAAKLALVLFALLCALGDALRRAASRLGGAHPTATSGALGKLVRFPPDVLPLGGDG
ncbi:MAG: phytoene/squalene synthase family protein [Polyangiales bacterium]